MVDNTDLGKKRQGEKQVVSEMIALYCRKNHKCKEALCPSCAELEQYAHSRIDHCPFMETKTFCSNCAVHCYGKDMRQRIRTVMRYSGPRMLFYHPVMAIHHLISTLSEKKYMKKE